MSMSFTAIAKNIIAKNPNYRVIAIIDIGNYIVFNLDKKDHTGPITESDPLTFSVNKKTKATEQFNWGVYSGKTYNVLWEEG